MHLEIAQFLLGRLRKTGHMLIEVLYVPGCPNHRPLIERLQDVLRGESVAETIHEIPVSDEATAASLQFPGSPTVRINGVDAEPIAPLHFGLTCRLYSNGRGLPSEQVLQRAISLARIEME
jgi:hypothetical protein